MRNKLLVLALVIAGVALGYGLFLGRGAAVKPALAVSPGAARGWNVLLITLDSVRPDFLGCYGRTNAGTPAIDALAKEGIRFAHAVTAVPVTRPAHATIMTGLLPPHHGVRDNGPFRLSESHQTLAESLKATGYATAAFVASFVLDARYGLNQGFDTYDDDMTDGRLTRGQLYPSPRRRSDAVTDSAIHWLDNREDLSTDRSLEKGRDTGPPGEPEGRTSTAPFFVWVHYRDKTRTVDEQVGRLVNFVRERKIGDRTVIVLVGAHGEAYGEHSEDGHGLLLYEPTVSIPMIWHAPALFGESRVVAGQLVGTVDVVPSLLDLLGVSAGPSVDGLSLVRFVRAPDEPLYMETLAPKLRHGWSPLFALRRLGDKLIHAPAPEYYDLGTDPAEEHNLLAETQPPHPPLAKGGKGEVVPLRDGEQQAAPAAKAGQAARGRELREVMKKTLAALGSDLLDVAAPASAFADTFEQLARLGYEPLLPPADEPVDRDQKSMMRTYEQHRMALYLLSLGRFEESAGISEGVLEWATDDGMAWAALSEAWGNLGRLDPALQASLQAVRCQPWERHWIRLASLLSRKGDLEACNVALGPMNTIDPADGEIALLHAVTASAEQRYEEALELCEEARRMDPARRTADAYAFTATVLMGRGEIDTAREAYHQALEHDAGHVLTLQGLAGVAQRTGNLEGQAIYMRRLVEHRPSTIIYANTLAKLYIQLVRDDEAITVMKDFISRNPSHVAAVGNLGNVFMETGHPERAIDTYRRAVELSPDYAVVRLNLGAALAEYGDVDGAIQQYRKVLELSPTHTGTFARLIRLLVGQERTDAAFAELERAETSDAVDWEALARDDQLAALVGDPRFEELRKEASKRKNVEKSEQPGE